MPPGKISTAAHNRIRVGVEDIDGLFIDRYFKGYILLVMDRCRAQSVIALLTTIAFRQGQHFRPFGPKIVRIRSRTMLKKEQSNLLTQTGPGTPAGRLFRSYWIPALLAA